MRQWPEVRDHSENLCEQCSRHSNLSQLKCDVAPVPHNFRPDLDQLLPNRCERPVAHFIGQGQRPHEVPKVVGEGEELEPRLVVLEPLAGKLRPVNRVLSFLDPLLP